MGGAAHFDNVSKAFLASLTTAIFQSHFQSSASEDPKLGIPEFMNSRIPGRGLAMAALPGSLSGFPGRVGYVTLCNPDGGYSGVPAFGHSLGANLMLKELRGTVTDCYSGKGRGLTVVPSPRQSCRAREERPASLKRRGHLRLLKGDIGGRDGAIGEISLPQEEITSTGTGIMPKRQHERHAYKDDAEAGVAPGQEASVGSPTIKREFMLTQTADDTLDQAVRLLGRSTGTRLSNSHFLRILLKCVAQAMPELEKKALKIGKLSRPSNAPESQAHREVYERTLAAAVLDALQSSPRLTTDSGDRRSRKGPGKNSA